MRRREFISFVGGAAAWPVMAWGQDRLRRIGVLLGQAATDPVSQARNAAFLQGLQARGWMIGRNVEIEYRWAPDDVDNSRRNAEDLVALAPDVILVTGSVNMGPLLQVTRKQFNASATLFFNLVGVIEWQSVAVAQHEKKLNTPDCLIEHSLVKNRKRLQ